LRIDRYRLTHAKFDGGRTPVLSRELMERGHAVALLPYRGWWKSWPGSWTRERAPRRW
jgi:hypothetical protein